MFRLIILISLIAFAFAHPNLRQLRQTDVQPINNNQLGNGDSAQIPSESGTNIDERFGGRRPYGYGHGGYGHGYPNYGHGGYGQHHHHGHYQPHYGGGGFYPNQGGYYPGGYGGGYYPGQGGFIG